ncbi:type 1 glutamine amidotransferase [Rhodobacteraceae bacterium]|nr:type 1 glutamine amidotransferase [Paracoccaceae bacterium]
MPKISDSKILILATHGFEQSELEAPRDKLRGVGAHVDVASLDGRPIKGWSGDDWGDTVPADVDFNEVSTGDYDALILPGGQINPDILRTKPKVVEFIRTFFNEKKIIAAICHGPWLLVEADIVKGRKLTSYHSIKTDVINAGAEWKDEAVVNDQGFITSRNPGDLDAFVSKIIEEVEEGRHTQRAVA